MDLKFLPELVNNMEKYLKIYGALLKTSISRMLSYRFNTVVHLFITTSIWIFMTTFSMYLITLKTGSVFDWTAGELVLNACIYNVFIGIFSFFFVRSINEFSELVDKGTFDFILLKPFDSQFYTSLRNPYLPSLFRTFVGILLMIFIITTYNISVNLLSVVLFVFALLMGILLLYFCLFILNTFIIWAPKLDNINELFYTLRAVGRFPRETFIQLNEIFFVLLAPFIIITATPTRILIGKATSYEMGELVVFTIVMGIVARLFWKFALGHYTSASS
ncbi:MAG: ABC-2 family transporter protein [Patescibacteria group bacterium]